MLAVEGRASSPASPSLGGVSRESSAFPEAQICAAVAVAYADLQRCAAKTLFIGTEFRTVSQVKCSTGADSIQIWIRGGNELAKAVEDAHDPTLWEGILTEVLDEGTDKSFPLTPVKSIQGRAVDILIHRYTGSDCATARYLFPEAENVHKYQGVETRHREIVNNEVGVTKLNKLKEWTKPDGKRPYARR